MAHNQSAKRRILKEPGGVLVLLLDLPDTEIESTITRFLDDANINSVTVLALPRQKNHVALADEVWWLERLGPFGLIAMLRRISWRRFEAVYQPHQAANRSGYSWLRFSFCPDLCGTIHLILLDFLVRSPKHSNIFAETSEEIER